MWGSGMINLIQQVKKVKTASHNKLALHQTHPNLFNQMVIWAVLCFAITAVVIIPHTSNQSPSVNPAIVAITRPLFGLAFFIAGACISYGISNGPQRYRWARLGLLIVVGFGLLTATSFWVALFLGKTTIYSFAIFWTVWSASAMVWASEPAFNPVAAAIKGGKDDEHI